MNSPIRYQQQQQQQQHVVQQQYIPQHMPQNVPNPQLRDSNKYLQQPQQMQNRFVPNHTPYQNQAQDVSPQVRYNPQQGYPQKPTPVARPHSADFLEFERRHPLGAQSTNANNPELLNEEVRGVFRPQINSTTPNRYAKHRGQGGNPQPPRPKSSIEHRSPKISQDVMGYHDDSTVNDVAMELSNYDWSEEGYADKMRNMDRQSRSRSQSRASQSHNFGGMDAANNHNNNMRHHRPSNPNNHTAHMGSEYQHNQGSNPYPHMNPQHMYQDHRHSTNAGIGNLQNVNGHHNINAEPSPRDSHADANEEIQGYFPTPLPRKPHTPSSYMNIPQQHQHAISRHGAGNKHPQSNGYSNNIRMGSMTPNRFTAAEILAAKRQNETMENRIDGTAIADPNYDGDAGEFKRSASARLHRNKRNYPDLFGEPNLIQPSGAQMQNGNVPEDNRRKEQREESMKRLLEWKQRMLQSPLTRKSSRNTSRAQTPTNSSSPAPSMSNTGNQQHGDHIRQKVLVELDRHQISSAKMANSNNTSVSSSKSPQQNISNGTNSVNVSRKVSRKGSGASRSSRSRSSPRVSNRPTTSSSDEGKSILTIASKIKYRNKKNITKVLQFP